MLIIRVQTVLLSMIFLSSLALAEDCKISGRAVLWPYDSCFWEYETDDSIHPGVIECVDKAQKEINMHGECQAKRLFKSGICGLAKKWGFTDPDPETCMTLDRPLGSAVRESGI